MRNKLFDVAVAGGGISGVCAAIGAARAGANVILIERYGFLGGTLTACGTGPMMTFHAGETQVVGGVCAEVIERLKQKGLSPGHIYDTTAYTYTVTPFDSEGMKLELEAMCQEAGVTLLYHTCVTGVDKKDGKITAVSVYHKNGGEKIRAKMFVDASGDCDLSFLAGAKVNKGRKADGKCQPVTMNFKVTNVDTDKVKAYIKTHGEEFPRLKGYLGIVDRSSRLSIGGFTKTLQNARRDGRVTFLREDILFFETNRKGEFIVNTTRVTGIDPTDPADLTKAEFEGRKQAQEILAVLKRDISGFEESYLEFTGPFIGIRSSRQIEGKHVITEEELISCKRFSDTVAHGGYPIDIHSPDGLNENMFEEKGLAPGAFYSIPLSALYGELHNLITVGRCISVTFEAQAAVRVSPIAGATGHAGGVAAAVCAIDNINIDDVNIEAVQKELKKQGAFLAV